MDLNLTMDAVAARFGSRRRHSSGSIPLRFSTVIGQPFFIRKLRILLALSYRPRSNLFRA
jgi:hypothetical protein